MKKKMFGAKPAKAKLAMPKPKAAPAKKAKKVPAPKKTVGKTKPKTPKLPANMEQFREDDYSMAM